MTCESAEMTTESMARFTALPLSTPVRTDGRDAFVE